MHALVLWCTAFALDLGGRSVMGKSYDWDMGQGLVMVNKRGLAKQALPMRPGDHPAAWVSRHASLTFNQYGRELPNGGLNDAGLAVEVLMLSSSRYAAPDARPTVNELQWIQYQLDSFASVEEMVRAADQLRISLVHGKVHYLACDAGGACASFEVLDGKMVVTSGAALGKRVLTNDTYADSLAYAHKHEGGAPSGGGSLDRFLRTATLVTRPTGDDAVAAAFRVLDAAASSSSVWNIVYEPRARRVWFRTQKDKRIKSVALGDFDGSCASAVKLIDIDAAAEGDVARRFVDYSDDANRQLVERSVKGMRGQLPAGAVEAVERYPSQLPCVAR